MLNNEKIKREEGDDAIDKKVTDEIVQVQDVIVNDKKIGSKLKKLSWKCLEFW